jgi:hypothetical protein
MAERLSGKCVIGYCPGSFCGLTDNTAGRLAARRRSAAQPGADKRVVSLGQASSGAALRLKKPGKPPFTGSYLALVRFEPAVIPSLHVVKLEESYDISFKGNDHRFAEIEIFREVHGR